jgi:NAD(P)-dependent dehydrogenase (short-subunit alcohol dehydrogenase family)
MTFRLPSSFEEPLQADAEQHERRHMEDLGGRTAVVIGGGSGIGRGTALQLASEGARVVVADIDGASAESVADEISQSDGTAIAAMVDATDRDSLGALVETSRAAFGHVHLLANNVGVVTNTRLDEASEADWAWVIEFNLMSIVRAVDVFLPSLREHGEPAHIVNNASMAALVIRTGNLHLGLYTATKHALLGYTEVLRHELAAEGIGVSILCPGQVVSNIARSSARVRPERYGGPLAPPPVPAGATMPARALPAEEVGRLVVRAIKENRTHILTHTDSLAPIEARHGRLIEDVAFLLTGLSAP